MKRVRNRIAAALLTALLLAAAALPAFADFNQDTLNGIVMITTGAPDKDGHMNYWRGTGFFVGEAGKDPQYIVTNCHVVEEFILAGKALGGGNSGGPLIDGSGAVIGINTAGSKLDSNLFYAVSVGEVLPLLDKNSIPYTLAPETKTGGSTMLYVGIGAVALVVIVIAAVVLSKKKKAPAAPKVQEAKGAPVLRSMAPQHGGMVVQLHGQPVQIGRDGAVCRLVYQDGTPGVSGRHCQVSFEQGEFVLTDLNSTYGTFLSNGQRVAPNSPVKLPPKSSFYLGEADNTVYVDLE